MQCVNLRIESKSEMKEFLRNCKSKYLLLGEDSQVEGGLYIFEIKEENLLKLTIGLITEGHGLQPECKIIGEKILIGFNKEIHTINITTNENNKIKTDSLFYEFASENYDDKVIAIFELGVMCLSLNGEKVWEYYTDIISDYSIESENINIITDLGEEQISLLTGKRYNTD